MKKNIFLIMFLFMLSMFLPHRIHADAGCSQPSAANCECNDVGVRSEVDGTGNNTNWITFQGFECNDQYTYQVMIQKSVSHTVWDDLLPLNLTRDSCGAFYQYCPENPRPYYLNSSGTYRALIYSTKKDTGERQSDRYRTFTIVETDEVADPTADEGPSADIALCDDDSSIVSSIGCIPFGNTVKLVAGIANIGVGLGGGMALLLGGLAAFKVMTAQSSPQRLAEGKDMIMGAVGGTIMVVLSGFLLRFLGVKILGLF